MDYKSQHFIGEGYLRSWRDPSTPNGAYVWTRDKQGNNVRRMSPSRLFAEYEFYTVLHHEERILELETRLHEIETEFGKLSQESTKKFL